MGYSKQESIHIGKEKEKFLLLHLSSLSVLFLPVYRSFSSNAEVLL